VVRQVLALVENIGFWRDLERSLRARSEALQESRRVEERLTHRALHDPLTGLGNRDLLFEQLERALPVAAGEGAFPAVLFIDLDDFKSVNDRLGHLAGDALLVEIARRLEAAARAGDTVARLGGDEFAILAEGVPGEGAVRQLAERVLAALRRPVDLGGVELAPRMSLGIAVAQRSDRPSELVRRADVAMYAAKAGGAGDYCLFDRELAVEDRLPSAF
jgi:diguanylate cyclase (GGDEF)-like protein